MTIRTIYPLKADSFTVEDFNDRPKPCLEKECKGKVYPTRNVNVGKCNNCGRSFNWGEFPR